MALRAIWRGHLRLALVSCPVALYNTRHDRDSIHFNLINAATGNRIKMVTQDAETGEEISRADTVKGFEFKKDTYLIVSNADLDSVKIDSSSAMVIEKFIAPDAIDPLYFDSSFYLAPDNPSAHDLYATLRAAIVTTGRIALTRVVIGGQERTMALRTVPDGMMAHTLLEQRDLNPSDKIFVKLDAVPVDPTMVRLVTQLIDRRNATYDPSDLEDRYQTRLRQMLAAKLKANGVDDATVPWLVSLNLADWKERVIDSVGPSEPVAAPTLKRGRKRRHSD